MAQVEAPKIEFPCENYMVKVMAEVGEDVRQQIDQMMLRFDPAIDMSRTNDRLSAKGNFISYSYYMTAQSKEQLDALNQALRTIAAVKMVL